MASQPWDDGGEEEECFSSTVGGDIRWPDAAPPGLTADLSRAISHGWLAVGHRTSPASRAGRARAAVHPLPQRGEGSRHRAPLILRHAHRRWDTMAAGIEARGESSKAIHLIWTAVGLSPHALLA